MLFFLLNLSMTSAKGKVGAGLLNGGSECWKSCNEESGRCSFCGTGKCCRRNWKNGEYGCGKKEGGRRKHVCVKARKLKLGENCWKDCNGKSGECSMCKNGGRCCRKNWKGGEAGCDVNEGGDQKHVCVPGCKKGAKFESPSGKPMNKCEAPAESKVGCSVATDSRGCSVCGCEPQPEIKPIVMKRECCNTLGAINPDLVKCPPGAKKVRKQKPDFNCYKNGKYKKRTSCPAPGWKCVGGIKPLRDAECCTSVGRRRAVNPDVVKCRDNEYKQRKTHYERNCTKNGELKAVQKCLSPGWKCVDVCDYENVTVDKRNKVFFCQLGDL